ncbi:unnamed protein product [Effrenium voratum]|nr:unnamed protein product [Effrenium voratum]
MLRQMWMALASYFAVAFGDAEPGSTTSSSTMMLDTGTDCNPYQGTRYITLGNGDSVTSTVCKDSWDLYEVAVYDDQNQEITELEISSGSTTIECDDVGCRATGHNPTFVNRSAACVASKAGHGMWLGLASYFAVAFGDGEPDCNPYQGNGDSITSPLCKDSWDLHEVAVYDDQNQEITGIMATAPTGAHDIGMSCSCWDYSKQDAQHILLDLGTTQKVSKINIWQGGVGNNWAIWAVSRLRIHCHSAQLNANPLELDISSGSTTIECDDVGCRAIDHNPALVNRSAACVASKAGHGAPVGLLLGLGLLASAGC